MRININPKVKISDVLFTACMVFVLSFPGPSPLKAVSIIAFFCYMMVLKLMRYRTIQNTVHIVGAFLFLGYAYISKKWALYPTAVSEQINNVLWTVLLSSAISTYVIYRDLSIKDIAIRLIPIVMLLLVNVLLNASFVNNRFSVGINANTFGMISSGMAVYWLYQSKQNNWKNGFLNVLVAVLALFVFLTGSRKALLSLVIYTAAILLFENYSKNSIKTIGKILLILVLAGIVYVCILKIGLLYNTIGHRVESMVLGLMGDDGGDTSFVSRLNMMNLARDLFLEHLWFGIGLNNFKYATYYNTYAHSNYYELAACLGIVGLMLYYLPIFIYFFKAIKKWKKGIPGMIVPVVVIAVYIINDVGNVTYFGVATHTFLSLAIGQVCRKNKVEQQL